MENTRDVDCLEGKKFCLDALSGAARAGRLFTAHGVISTPAFMPVGTQGSVKSLSPADLREAGAEIILSNTYHLYLRPGDELIAALGGLHHFCGWSGPILTDSGGFQVFSLSSLRKITGDGVEFRSHIDGSRHFFDPEKVVAIQRNLGVDIMMVLDECVPYGADRAYTENSLELTAAWAARARKAMPESDRQLMFGIIQGGFFSDLRRRSVRQITSIDFDGYALGGLSVGESRVEMLDILRDCAPLMPPIKPRYLMGVGTPQDILDGIECGIDMFDCVLPTRNARTGALFTSQGQISIKQTRYKADETALDPECTCYTCRNFSKAYLRHLYMARELLSYRLNSLHNLCFYQKLVHEARQAIIRNEYSGFKASLLDKFQENTLK